MAGNATERKGREQTSRERDSKRLPARASSRERARSPGDTARRGRVHESRPGPSSNTFPPSSRRETNRSKSPGGRAARGRNHRRSPSPSGDRRARYDHATAQQEKPGEERTSHPERPTPASKRPLDKPTSPSRHNDRDIKRRRSHDREKSPARSIRSRAHERSPEPHPARPRRRSRSADSRYRPQRSARWPSPEERARAREDTRGRYRSPPRYDRRRYTPPPPERRAADYSSRRYPEDYYDSRHSRAAPRSPPRKSRRSASPSDFISQLATNETKSSRAHRPSRSPPARDHREEPRRRERVRERSRHGYYDRSPRRDRYRDERDADMYGRGGPQRPPQPYMDPRYSQSPHYPLHAGSPPHAQSPYGRGGYPQQQPYASYHGSPVHAYSPQQSPYYAQGYPPPGASPYYQAQPTHYAAPQHAHAPPPVHHAYPPQSHHRPGPPAAPRGGHPSSQRPAAPSHGSSRPRGGHFSNLSWTPTTGSRGGKVGSNNKRDSSTSGGMTPVVPASADSIDDEDNPFRPPKDLRVDDETDRKNEQAGNKPASKPGISFSIKGKAEREKTPEPKMRREIVVKKRLKPKPKLSEEFTTSDSVYHRKTGNESVVGSGTYGKVYKGVHVYTNDKVALKKIRMEGERDGFPVTAIREVRLLQSLNHENVVKLQEVMVERNDCYMIFEYLSHDLTGLLNHPSFVLTAAHKKHLAKQLFEGLDYLHKRGVLHRDIKAANILVSSDGVLKLADFGLARFYNKTAKRKQDYTNRVITIWYRSPELLLGETQYGPSVDIWSAACVLVEIFTRHAIFPGDGGEINQLDKIYNVLGTPSRSEWPGIAELAWYELLRPAQRLPSTFAEKYTDKMSPAAFELLSAMFQYDPNARPSASDVLEHPYFTAEEPVAQQVVELKDLEGDWHEFESKALRKEKEREARRKDREGADKRKVEGASTDERESKRVRTAEAQV